jgi:Tol biopolymer transport system component/DNA-binding winged helix-turn-helix (wHTH) protein
MQSEDGISQAVRFGPFEFEVRTRELRRGDTRLKVPDQSLEILTALLERPGQLVTREDLRQRLWPPDTFVDFQSGLNAAVRRLREALHDSADEPRFIETLPRRGYRFIGEVAGSPAGSGPSPPVAATSCGPTTEAADSAGTQADPAPHAPSRRRWAWIMVLVSVALAGAYLAWTRRTPPKALAFREVALTTLQGAEASPTFAPDGEQVAFAWSGPNQDNPDIYVQRIGSGTELRRTVDPAWDFSPVWSPDGQWIAFLRGEVPGRSDVMLIPPLGGAEHRLGEIHIRQGFIIPPYLSWLPDSRALVVVNSASPQETEALFVMSVDTGELRQLTTATLSYPHQQPSVSPDGRTVVFFKRGAPLCLVGLTPDLRAASEPRVLPLTSRAIHPTWTPDGKEIVYSDGERLWRLDATARAAPTPLPFATQNAIMPVISGRAAGRPGRLVYVQRTTDINLWRLDLVALGMATSSAATLFHSSTKTDYNAQFSPDGQRVAFQSDRSGDMQIWVGDADGANALKLTAMKPVNTGTPRWSPDGQTIAFDSSDEGQYEIYVVPSTGGKPRRLTFERTEDVVPSFSRDGRVLYFSSRRSGEYEIWKIPRAGGDAVQVTRNGGFVQFESFDGRYLYYTQTATDPSTLWRIPTAGGEPERVLEGVSHRGFVVLEKGIYYIEQLGLPKTDWAFDVGMGFLGRRGRARLRFLEFASARSRVVADIGERLGLGLGVSPDGRTIVFTRVDNPTSDLMMVENFR